MRTERQELADRALRLRSQGLTLKQIGARLGRSESEISRLVRAPAPALADVEA
jgi:transcriptional regulator with XRE-family HTH domain